MQNCKRCGGKRWFASIDKKTGKQRKHHIKTVDGYEYDLRVWRCFRCDEVQEEVHPTSIPQHVRRGPNILYFDLEVSKSKYYSYGARVPSTFLNVDDLIQEYYIIAWSASYVGQDKIYSGCVTGEQARRWDDKEILEPLRELLESADIVAGHNVDKYDIKRINTRLLLNGFEPVVGKKTLDTLKIARGKFTFESNKLDYISQRLGFRPKDDIRNSDWLAIVDRGDEPTLKKVAKYCRGDVRNGKGVLERLMKYSGKKVWYGSITLE